MTELEFLKQLKTQKYLSNFDDNQIRLIHLEYLKTIIDNVIANKYLKIRGFGAFKLYDIKGNIKQIGDNKVIIKPQKTIKFKLSKKLRDDINNMLNNVEIK